MAIEEFLKNYILSSLKLFTSSNWATIVEPYSWVLGPKEKLFYNNILIFYLKRRNR